MSSNIFQIWDSIGRKTPFAVRRDNWSNDYYTIVEAVDCEKLPYGRAYGYPTIKGNFSSHYEYDKKWCEDKLIPCCGCYQWTLVENVGLTSSVDREIATKKTVKSAYTVNSKFFFGKYKGVSVEDTFRVDPNYILWAISNLDKFFLTQEAYDYLEKIKPSFFNDNTRQVNQQKLEKHK